MAVLADNNQSATIFALSSGQPPAGVAVVRISGPEAGPVIDRLTRRQRPVPRRATLRTLIDPAGHDPLDRALILWLPGPSSATGEDMAELHLHGGRAVTASVMKALATLPGLRIAAPGEFTRRAFETGRIDLNEAEALADLLAAETEGQRRNAMLLATGALSRAIERWQTRLLALSAQLEAMLDFSDEDDVASSIDSRSADELASLAAEIDRWRGRAPVERLRDGVRVVLAGPPNAGKSTLLNALAGRDAAIVTPVAGTTRDLIEVPVALGGVGFLLIDTAGLHDGADDEVEQIGIGRAGQAIAAADIVLWLGQPADSPPGAIRIGAQADRRINDGTVDLSLSAVTGEGLADLIDLLIVKASRLLPSENEAALSARQRDHVEEVHRALSQGLAEADPLLVAESLRMARLALDRLTGKAGTEDMLDALFGRFCIGK